MTRAVWAAAALVALAGAGWAWVLLAPSDPARWHVDPLAGGSTGWPNEARAAPAPPADIVSPVWPETPEALAARLDAVAMAEPRTTRLADAGGFVTYVQRSATVGFPDYVSARAVPVEGGAALAIWSRSRFGLGDAGVNRARLERWVAALGAP